MFSSSIHTPVQSYMLRDIVEVSVAPSVSWMPQTLGWKVVGIIALLCAMAWVYKSLLLWWNNRYRREAVVSLNLMLEACKSADSTDKAYCQQISQDVYSVLKAVLSAVNPQTRALYGQSFLQALDDQADPDLTVFASQWSHWPDSLLVKNNALDTKELQALITDSQRWVKHHATQISGEHGEMSDA